MSIIYINSYRFASAAAPPLLDTYSGAAAAYSLRQLRTGVTNVVRVRRSSDNVEQDFTAAQITDGTLTAFCGAGDGFVRTWYDQSGNSNHAQQTATANQPKLVSSGSILVSNNKPAMQLDGAGDTLTSTVSGLNTSLAITVFTLNTPTLASAPDATTTILFGLGSGGGSILTRGLAFGGATGVVSGETICFYHSSDSFAGAGRLGSSTYTRSANAQSLHTAILSVNQGIAYKNSTQINLDLSGNNMTTTTDNSPLATGASAATFHIGTINGNSLGVSQSFQEVIVYATSETANRAAIEANINAHYGIF